MLRQVAPQGEGGRESSNRETEPRKTATSAAGRGARGTRRELREKPREGIVGGIELGPGQSRRSLRRPGALAVLLVALVASACLLPGSASAIEARTLTESFGPDGTKEKEGTASAISARSPSIRATSASTPSTRANTRSTASTPRPRRAIRRSAAASRCVEPTANSTTTSPSTASRTTSTSPTAKGKSSSALTKTAPPCPASRSAASATSAASRSTRPGNVWVADATKARSTSTAPARRPDPKFTDSGTLRFAVDAEDNLFVTQFFLGPTKKYTAASGYTASTRDRPGTQLRARRRPLDRRTLRRPPRTTSASTTKTAPSSTNSAPAVNTRRTRRHRHRRSDRRSLRLRSRTRQDPCLRPAGSPCRK